MRIFPPLPVNRNCNTLKVSSPAKKSQDAREKQNESNKESWNWALLQTWHPSSHESNMVAFGGVSILVLIIAVHLGEVTRGHSYHHYHRVTKKNGTFLPSHKQEQGTSQERQFETSWHFRWTFFFRKVAVARRRQPRKKKRSHSHFAMSRGPFSSLYWILGRATNSNGDYNSLVTNRPK